jgi:hypothetical protein
LFICGLFKDCVADSIIRRRIIELLVNDELEMIWKETTITKFRVLSRDLHGGTGKALVKISSFLAEI